MKKQWLALALVLALVSGCGGGAGAEKAWPGRGITIDGAYTAGGTADTANRQLAAILGSCWKPIFRW